VLDTKAAFDHSATPIELAQEIRLGLLDARSAEAKAGRALHELRRRIEAKSIDWWPWFTSNFLISRKRAASLMRMADAACVEPEPITCVACGMEFTPSRRRAKTCSNACRQRAYRGRRGGGPR
jgi:hypothetical protein